VFVRRGRQRLRGHLTITGDVERYVTRLRLAEHRSELSEDELESCERLGTEVDRPR
jgi:hypothetical protein